MDRKTIQKIYYKRNKDKTKAAKLYKDLKCAAKGCRWKAMPGAFTCLNHNNVGGKWYGCSI